MRLGVHSEFHGCSDGNLVAMTIHVLLSVFRTGKCAMTVQTSNSARKEGVPVKRSALEEILFVQLADGDALTRNLGMEMSAPTMVVETILGGECNYLATLAVAFTAAVAPISAIEEILVARLVRKIRWHLLGDKRVRGSRFCRRRTACFSSWCFRLHDCSGVFRDFCTKGGRLCTRTARISRWQRHVCVHGCGVFSDFGRRGIRVFLGTTSRFGGRLGIDDSWLFGFVRSISERLASNWGSIFGRNIGRSLVCFGSLSSFGFWRHFFLYGK